MMEQNTEVKLKQLLKEERIQLWNPPFSDSGGESSQPHMQELAERFAPRLCLPVSEVGGALEAVRLQALSRGQEKKSFRERGVATLELLLPRGCRKAKTKSHLETRLDVLVQEVVDRIRDEFGLKCIKLILNGRTLSVDQTLDQQGVKNHSKMMVLKISDAEWKLQLSEEEEKKKNQNESLQRTQKGFQILSERDGSEDSSPFLEIADQRGNPLKIPPEEKKALILAMGFHERGRSLMKKKQFDNALCHLLQADQQFSRCGSALLSSVDNPAVLQLDVVWCYRALEALCCLDDGRSRLQRAELCFLSCYGERQQRLRLLKGNTGREEVLFLRLHLLQSLLSYIEGNDVQARHQLSKVEALYSRLCPDPLKVAHLLSLGFSEREARLGLRACEGQLEEAVVHIRTQRQEREEVQQRERKRRSRRSEGVSTLTELGFSRRDASRALQHADGDVDRAYQILLDSSGSDQTTGTTEGSLEQLLYLGFQRDVSQAALRLTGGDVQSATQLLLDHQGALPPELLAGAPPPEEPSTSSTGSTEDRQLVSELLEDISHEDDYLDLTLEEERDLITSMKTYLSRGDTHTP